MAWPLPAVADGLITQDKIIDGTATLLCIEGGVIDVDDGMDGRLFGQRHF